MNQLIKKSDTLDLKFFIPSVFDIEEVVSWVFQGLQETEDKQAIPSLGIFPRSVMTIFWFGIIGRYLGAGITSYCHSEYQESVLDELLETHGLDYWEITSDERYENATEFRHIDPNDYELYVTDVMKIWSSYNVFFINSTYPWYGLADFSPLELALPQMRINVHPYSDEVRPLLFHNMPIVKVW